MATTPDAQPAAAAPSKTRRPDVLFLLADTLRADALGAWGGDPTRTPALNRLSERAVVFDFASSQAPWTLPSVASLLTSNFPSTLRPMEEPWETMPVMPAELPWLARRLGAAGYYTAGFTKNTMLRPGTGFETGFDVYEYVDGHGSELTAAGELVDHVLAWLDKPRPADRPLFLFLHFMDPHTPYRPAPEFLSDAARAYQGPVDGSHESLLALQRQGAAASPADVAQARELYLNEVSYMDSEIGRLLDSLEQRGVIRDDSVVVVTSDHGEQFGEHGDFEHDDLHVENIHVPLILSLPGYDARRVGPPVRLVDVVPTLTEYLAVAPTGTDEGRSLMPLLRGEAVPALLIATDYDMAMRVFDERLALIRDEHGQELFDVANDRLEAHDIFDPDAEETQRMQALMRAHQFRNRPEMTQALGGSAPLTAGVREKLEKLGYLPPQP